MAETRTILVAEQNPTLLELLRQQLEQAGWPTQTATDFQEAAALLERRPVGMVIAGFRDAAERPGVAFLEQVRGSLPDAIRIMLAGQGTDAEVADGLFRGTFSEVIPVPWGQLELTEMLARAFRARQDVGQNQGLQALLAKLGPLPAQPLIHQKVQAELRKKERASIPRIAEMIVQDPAITAEILRVANAAHFGQRQRISTVQRAVVVLGLELTSYLLLLVSVSASMKPRVAGVSFEAFRTHSLAVGLAASYLQARTGGDRRQAERAMVGGLLHDVGKLVYAHFLPREYAEVLRATCARETSLETVELEQVGVSHSALGGHLAEQWHLPPAVIAAIRWHHEPAAGGTHKSLVALVQLADEIARDVDVGFSGNFQAPAPYAYRPNLPRVPADAVERARDEIERLKQTGDFALAWG